MLKKLTFLLLSSALTLGSVSAKPKSETKSDDKKDLIESTNLGGLKFRLIGPGVISGRISDLAFNPNNKSEFYVAVASSGVWKTTNAGISFAPVFDGASSFSIGCITIDPNNPYCVWVGSGENNSQRSVSWGDGVYRSTDGGASWTNMGLKSSEHIGKIIVDPRNSNVIYVASQGPLWGSGGERGLYKSTDAGKTWEQSLKISENTGVTDIAIDPRNPDIIYAASYQRRRHVWTMIDGGPESAIYKSTDAGKTWDKLTNGLPGGDLGKIGIAVSPANPDIIYSVIEANEGKGGIYVSTNRGGSWSKRNEWFSGSAQYYQEIVCDPKNADRAFFIDTYLRETRDGGKTLRNVSNNRRHVDDHSLWIDPDNTNHIYIGGDGGLYESYDDGETSRFFSNLPIAQMYRVGIDNATPFYNVYGGTQDNNSWGGPSRTTNSGGILNEDWFLLVGGDGYQARVDPKDPNIIYAQWQYGNVVRYDRKSGETFYIQPQAEKGEELRWNWDTPLIISSHLNTRLYIAANKLFQSDDRGQSWKAISNELTRNVDRNKLPVMGKIWSPEAVAKNASTSLYGNSIAISESPINEKLLYVGTDDGCINVTNDGGKSWIKYENYPYIPGGTYVSDLFASNHDENVVYASFDNHKNSDFTPYVMKSTDKCGTWKTISTNLPTNGPVYSIVEDPVDPNLLFVGTEFGAFFSINGGEKWIQFKNELPISPVKDIEIQKRENDLVLATFGRGIYILDDITPLRNLKPETLEESFKMFPIKDALMYNEDDSKSKNDHGESLYRGKNPDFGAVFTYYVKETPKTLKQIRKDEEKKNEADLKPIDYPSFDKLRAEDNEEKPYLAFRISDTDGNLIRTLTSGFNAGINRINWDMRYPSVSPLNENTDINRHSGFQAVPGKYFVQAYKVIDGKFESLGAKTEFNCKLLDNVSLPAKDMKALGEFRRKVAKLENAIYSTNRAIDESDRRIALIKKSLLSAVNSKTDFIEKISALDKKIEDIKIVMNGDKSLSKRNENQTPSVNNRIDYILTGIWSSSSEPSQTQKDAYKIASEQLSGVLDSLKKLNNDGIAPIEKELDNIDAPWTPGRIPNWKE